jgi:hypothetical protein
MNKTKVFEAGIQPDYSYSNDDIKAIADSYSQTAYSAPWVCGHDAKSGSPAMGWVRELEYTEENGVGTLWAKSDFNRVGQKLIDDGLYENKSISLYTPDSQFNPNPGQWSLRHVAMLGAEPPVLKNLGSIAVIDYSEEDTAFVSYSCSCQEKPDYTEQPMDLKAKYTALKAELAALEKQMEDTDDATKNSETTSEAIIVEEAVTEVVEEIAEEVTETIQDITEDITAMNELEKITAERDQLLALLSASKEANTALSVSSAVAPYYSEGVLTEDVLPEATLTNVLTKLTLGTSNYAEDATPIIVIEKLLQALIGSKPAEPEYGEQTTIEDVTAPETVGYSDGDELHELANKTAKSYGLSYGQALSAVVTANEVALSGKVNFSETLAEAVKGFKI